MCKLDEDASKKEVVSAILGKGLALFIGECEDELLHKCFVILNLGKEEDIESVGSHLKEWILDEAILGGVQDFFMTFPRDLLENWCFDYDIWNPRTLDYNEMVDKIMCVMFRLEPFEKWIKREDRSYKLKRPRAEWNVSKKMGSGSIEPAPKKTRRGPYICPPLSNIQKGITREELHNLYNLVDLQRWCQEKDIDPTGKKQLVIKRIYTFLETGEIQSKKKKRPMKSSKSSTKVSQPQNVS